MTRILVCGSRNWTDYDAIHDVLSGIHRTTPITLLIEGGASGADRFGRWWAQTNKVDILTFEADWKTHKDAAGPIRNQRMINEGLPDRVVAFPLKDPVTGMNSKGTANMIGLAKRAHLPVLEIVG